jgi:dihydrofolate reductase
MRRIRYAVAASLDAYIAGPNGEADWIIADPDIDFGELFSQFDTVLMGRRTFQPIANSFRSLAGMQLLDTVEVALIPILLGGGIRLLPCPTNHIKLRLIAQKVYNIGIVSLEYAIIP